MADNLEIVKLEEMQIPVFTVLKSNCILKNIYLISNPHSSSFSSIEENSSEIEETFVVGRHPDCRIKLEHPSISRFHLRIYCKTSSRSLYVTDLSSVHGTWISGKRVQPGIRIKLNEGDSLQLGGSSRLYSLNWIPYSQAYDVDNPFVPKLDMDTVNEETDESIYQDENSLSVESDELQTLSDNLEGLERLFSDENLCLSMQKPSLERLFSDKNLYLSTQKTSLSAPPMCENMYSSFPEEKSVENMNSPEKYNQENEISSIQLCQLDKENSTPRAQILSSASETEDTETSVMNSEKKTNLSIWSRRGKPKSVHIETCQSKGKSVTYKTEPVLENHYTSPDQIFTPEKENCSPCPLLSRSLKKKSEETLKNESVSKTPFSSEDLDDEEIFTPDKENMTPNTHLLRSMKNMGKLEEVKQPKPYRSSPLKRAINFNRDESVLLPSLHKENQHAKVLQERRLTGSSSKGRASLKKGQTFLKARGNRELYCKSSINPVMKTGRFFNYSESEEIINPHNETSEEKTRWVIIVDTGCLLNKKSRKELQLLRGLKGTNLLIPRIVVRELDCMLKRGSFFRRTTDVSEALQWIEDCMENVKGWIHVQSSDEESWLVPPTPPATSPHWFGEDNGPFSIGSVSFSPYGLQEIVTPTASDRILQYALFFNRTMNDGKLVLLSDDVTLKIKSMAEGVICETVEKFRGSLVNPFSERFLYSGSSPRGTTWSCADDAVLKEKYYPSPSKKLSKSGNVKGLKLILQHNSNFRQITQFN